MNVDVTRSWMVGDMISDIEAGRNAGCCGSILVRTGLGATTEATDGDMDYVADDLQAAANLIVQIDGTKQWTDVRRTTTKCDPFSSRDIVSGNG